MTSHDSDIDFVEEEEGEMRLKSKSEKKLRDALQTCQREKQDYLEGWQRAKADLINFKREAEGARDKYKQFAIEDCVVSLLPVIDSFEAALQHTDDAGIVQIHKQMLSSLSTQGVEQVGAVGEQFDPARHDSVGSVATDKKHDDNTVAAVVQTGYTLNDKVIRPARIHIFEYKQ